MAGTRTADLPSGHPLLTLIPLAHLEAHLARAPKGGDDLPEQATRTRRGQRGFSPLLATNETDDQHPRSMTAHQVFAYFYANSGHQSDKPRLAAHLARSGERASSWPWGYFGDHTHQFAKAQQTAPTTQ